MLYIVQLVYCHFIGITIGIYRAVYIYQLIGLRASGAHGALQQLGEPSADRAPTKSFQAKVEMHKGSRSLATFCLLCGVEYNYV